MKAVRIHQFGGTEALRLDNLPRPEPGLSEALIEVRAAGVNPVDYKIREGRYPPVRVDDLPVILGRDIAGIVRAVGPDAGSLKVGEEVYAMLPPDRGGYAEWVTLPAALCAAKPRSLDLVQAASVPLAALTAWQGLFTHGWLEAGQKVLIHGASGGVGPFAVQFAKAAGAKVCATASGEHRDFVESLGTDRVIDYRSEKFEQIVREVNLVFDLIGGQTQDRSWAVIRRGGALISTVQEPDREKADQYGVRAQRYTAQADGGQLAEIATLIDEGKVKVIVDEVFPLAQAAEAERHLKDDHVVGKVVLEVHVG